jgi:uncharacterized protein (DUF2141 family)
MHAQKLRLRLLAAALGLVCLASCAGPRLTRRYNTQVQVTVPAAQVEARLAAFSLDVPSNTAKTTLLNLSGRGQASLIGQLGAKSKDAADLLARLGAPIEGARARGGEVDRTVFARRVVFSIDDTSSGPADRISSARISLTELTPPARFIGWTQFATRYETADLGSLKFTQSRELALNAALSASQLTAGGQGKGSNQLEENLKLAQRYISVNGALSPFAAELIQQGAPGTDVAGNLAVDFTIQVDSKAHTNTFTFSPLFDDAEAPKPAGQVKITRQTVKYVEGPAADIKAKATLTATLRHVVSGDDTVMEGDDDVEFRTGPAPAVDLTLVPKESVEFSVWVLRDPDGRVLHISLSPDSIEAVQLASFGDAAALLSYLARVPDPGSIGGRPLSLPPAGPLDAARAKTLQVEILKLNWQ